MSACSLPGGAACAPPPSIPPPLHPAVWRGDSLARCELPAVATGFAGLDAVLPGGGWPSGALTEILAAREGIGELSLLAPALARLSGDAARWLLWVAPPHLPYAPALQAAGLDMGRVVVVQPRNAADALWATRQALAADACSAVLAWLSVPDAHSLRRLQLAVEGRNTLAFVFRPPFAARDFSPAPLRLQLDGAGDRLALRVLKRRGPHLAQPVLIDLPRPGGDDHVVACPLPAQSAAAGVPACCA